MSDLSSVFVQACEPSNGPEPEPGPGSGGAEQEAGDDQQLRIEGPSDTEDENPDVTSSSGQNDQNRSAFDGERGESAARECETGQFSASVGNQQVTASPPATSRQEDTITSPKEHQIDPTSASDKQQSPVPDSRGVLFLPPSSISRRSARAKPSKLVYDQKYHPLDDLICPSHAAKRRSIHGEECPSEDELSVSSFDGSDAGVDSDAERPSSEDEARPVNKGRKRVRFEAKSSEPTRRSSRQRAQPRVSYNACVHPQDDLLELAFAEDEAVNTPSANKEKRRSSDSGQGNDEQPDEQSCRRISRQYSGCVTVSSDDTIPESPDPFRSSSPSSPIEAVASDGHFPSTRKQLRSDQCFPRNPGSLPETRGEHFELWADNFKDQMANEANEASPLNFDHDDKENKISNPNLEPEPDANHGVSVMPFSLYQSSIENRRGTPIAQEALYSHDRAISSPYGLGGNATLGVNYNDAQYYPDYMRVLASGEHLPRDSAEE